MYKSATWEVTCLCLDKRWRALGQCVWRWRWGSVGRRSQEEARLREGLFGCSTQWVSCWKEVWTQFVSVVNLITASMKGWSHREQVPLTVESWFNTWSLRCWPCASCSISSPLEIHVSLHFHFRHLFLPRLPPYRWPLSLLFAMNHLQQWNADVTTGLQDSLAGPLCHGWPSRSFLLPPGCSLPALPPSVIHTCLDQSGQIGFNNCGQNAFRCNIVYVSLVTFIPNLF